MQKSVFTKYIFAFAIIIFISFSLLAVIISSIISSHAEETIRKEVNSTASVVVNVLEYDYEQNGGDESFEEYMAKDHSALYSFLFGVTAGKNANILLVADIDGNVLYGMDREEQLPHASESSTLPREIMDVLRAGEVYEGDNREMDFFPGEHTVCGMRLENSQGEAVGVVVVFSSSERETALIHELIRTVIMASLWVMLAAMIAVYFISDRITSPLRSMTAAAKNFARGEMDARVDVKGNDEIAELGTAFNNMADALKENETMRNSFLANVSHDMRTPMTTIAGFVDGMISGAIPPEKHGEYLEIVSSEVHRLSRLVSRILDVARLESGERKLTPTRFDICEKARLILISFEQKIEEKELEVQFVSDSDSMYVFGDSDAVHQVLYNLCENAIKFSRQGGTLRIEVSRKTLGVMEVAVYNEGEGIPTEDIPYVFERFYKSDKSRGLDKKGVGLGLYIVKTLLEAMHQTISVSSIPGENCEFRFTLQEDRS